MTTKIRIRVRRVFHRNVCSVRIDGKQWHYDKTLIDGEHVSVVFRREEVPLLP